LSDATEFVDDDSVRRLIVMLAVRQGLRERGITPPPIDKVALLESLNETEPTLQERGAA
jgi:hypothetical protein